MITTLRNLHRFFNEHPLTRDKPTAAWSRFLRHQLRVRLAGEITHHWVGGAKLSIRRSMTGATGNVYAGLHEFPEMGFLLHFLGPEDTFFDIGANIGSYTILASAVAGARSVAFEPDPGTAKSLRRNIDLNTIEHVVEVMQVAVGSVNGPVGFTTGLDTMNSLSSDAGGQEVQCVRLDDIKAPYPALMKIDVEGYEQGVLDGAAKLIKRPGLQALMVENLTEAMDATLVRAGFSRAYYDPLSRTLSESPLGLVESNALFVKEFVRCSARLQAADGFEINGRYI